MPPDPAHPADETARHFSCALSAVLLRYARVVAGDDGVRHLLERAGVTRSVEYLSDIGNWVSYDEAIGMLEAGTEVTGDPEFAWRVGAEFVRALGSSATSTVLRSLGSTEELLRKIPVTSQRFSTAAKLDAVEVAPGQAQIRAYAAPGFRRSKLHCKWTMGLLTQSSALFGLPPAEVTEQHCQAEGAEECLYRVTWDPSAGNEEASVEEQVAVLKRQLDAMSERLQNVFATAADLIATGDLNEVLARITDRAAHQVRAPRYLLAVRPTPGSPMHCHHRGLDAGEAERVAAELLAGATAQIPEHWLVAPVESHRRDYGRIVAIFPPGSTFFPQERQLLELYARYAAAALDSATALIEAQTRQVEAQRRAEEARTLLDLARKLASAGTTDQIAQRLADAIPGVVDCDRVSVYLWDAEAGELVRKAVNTNRPGTEELGPERANPDDIPRLQSWLAHPDTQPYFIDIEQSPMRDALHEIGAIASVAVPIATSEHFLGSAVVSVHHEPSRLAPNPELLDRLSGVAAHAVTALENGRLVDHITYQASHDRLTGLANRAGFTERMSTAVQRARDTGIALALFYIDLDGFKPVNDEHGHDVGDELLRQVADRLRGGVRGNDTVARLGGDEFAVLVEGLGAVEEVSHVGERLTRAFRTPFHVDGLKLRVGASIGRAVWPVDVSDLDELMRRADAAMYEEKRSRRGGEAARAAGR